MNKNIKEFTLEVPTNQSMVEAINALKALGLKTSHNVSELCFEDGLVLRFGGSNRMSYFWMSGLGPQRGNHYTNLGDLVVYLTTPKKTERQLRIEELELELAELKAQEEA